MLLLFPAMRLGIILLFASITNRRTIQIQITKVGFVGHYRPRQRACQEAIGIRSRSLLHKSLLPLFIGDDAGIIKRNAQIGGIPRHGDVTIADATEFSRFEYFFASFAHWQFPVGEGDVNWFMYSWDLKVENVASRGFLFAVIGAALFRGGHCEEDTPLRKEGRASG